MCVHEHKDDSFNCFSPSSFWRISQLARHLTSPSSYHRVSAPASSPLFWYIPVFSFSLWIPHISWILLASEHISDPASSHMRLTLYSVQACLLTTAFVSLAHSQTTALVYCWPLCSGLLPTNIHKLPYFVASKSYSQKGFLVHKEVGFVSTCYTVS